MSVQATNNIKLGFFVATGLLILIVSLYMIGRNKSLFGSNFEIRARFRNVNGLMRGNNVRFSGIQAGTVKDIVILNDTTIEVSMRIDKHIKNYIHKNSFASIGNEGLMGNKIINIEPNPVPAPVIAEGDMLQAGTEAKVDDMLQTLDKTNMNVMVISEDLKAVMKRINDSKVIRDLLDDTTISENVRQSLVNIRQASTRLDEMSAGLNTIVKDVNSGKGALGILLKDMPTAHNLQEAMEQINAASHNANDMAARLSSIAGIADSNLKTGKGLLPVLLKDSSMSTQLNTSLKNIEKGTKAFSEDMEALKHNFLLRGYFKKQARKTAGLKE